MVYLKLVYDEKEFMELGKEQFSQKLKKSQKIFLYFF